MNAITVRHNSETSLTFQDAEATSLTLKVGTFGGVPVFSKEAVSDGNGNWSLMLTIANINGIALGTYKWQINAVYPDITLIYPDPNVPGNEVLPDFIVLDSID